MKTYFATSADGIRPDNGYFDTAGEAIAQAKGMFTGPVPTHRTQIHVIRVTVEPVAIVAPRPREFDVEWSDDADA